MAEVTEKDLKPESKQLNTYRPDVIYMKGQELQGKIYSRIQRIEKVQAELLEEIAELLRRGAGEEGDPAEVAAVVLVALTDDYNLSGHAMSIKSFIERAAQLQGEQRDLVRFGKNLLPNAVYELSWDEADRFGL